MKNKIKYLVLYPLMLLVVILTFTYDVKELISLGQRIPFGSSYWKDSLSDAISTNKSIKLGTGDSLYYNGVVVTSGTGGGGIAASDNISFSGRNTTSDLWTFNDSAKFTRIVNMDSLRISGNLYQGTSRRFTAVNVNYNLENGFEWQNLNTYSLMTLDSASGLIIRRKFNSISDSVATDSKFYFSDTVKTNSRFIATDLATFTDSLKMTSYDIFLPNGKGLNWGELTGQIYSNAGELISRSATHTNYTLYGNFLNSSDSTNGFLVREKLEGYADTISSSSKFEFNDIVTFALSPVFSAVVNFANGITVTGQTTLSGYTAIGDSTNSLNIKTCMVKGKIGANTNTTYPFALPTHLLGNGFKRVVSFQSMVRNDSAVAGQKKNITPNSYFGSLVFYTTIDSANVNVVLPATSNCINDSVFVMIWYRSGGTSNE